MIRRSPFSTCSPRAPGHTWLSLRRRRADILDIKPDEVSKLIERVPALGRAAMKAFAADGLAVQQFNEPAGGQVVFHLHVHVIPRKIGVALKPAASFKEKPAILAEHAQKIAAALGG